MWIRIGTGRAAAMVVGVGSQLVAIATAGEGAVGVGEELIVRGGKRCIKQLAREGVPYYQWGGR
jgi:hypothetical protein